MPLPAQYSVLSRSKIQSFTCRKSGPTAGSAAMGEPLFFTIFVPSMGPEHGLGGAGVQAPLTGIHQSYLNPVKWPKGTMYAGARLKGCMDRSSSAGRAALNPRDALDILDIRTGKPGGTAELAGRTDADADVLHYLAVHGAPGTRQAV